MSHHWYIKTVNIFVKQMEKFEELLAVMDYTQYISQSPIP